MGCVSSKYEDKKVVVAAPVLQQEYADVEIWKPKHHAGGRLGARKQRQHLQLGASRAEQLENKEADAVVASATVRQTGPTDSASSAQAFLVWAQQQATAVHQPLDAFLSSNTSGTQDGQAHLDGGGSAGNMPATVAPYQPHNAYLVGPPPPACQQERCETARAVHSMMRSVEDGEIESMLGALCAAFQVETATMALLTGQCVHICGACGVLTPGICPDRWGFCGWSFINTNHELMVIEDMKADARFAGFFCLDPSFCLPGPFFLFYVAAPLISSNGHRLGTLCIMGQQPQTFDATRGQVLANMGEILVRQLERNWALQLKQREQGVHLARSLASYDTAYMLVDASKPDWRVIYMNPPAQAKLGVEWKVGKDLLPSLNEGRPLRFQGVGLETYFRLQHSTATWAPHCFDFTVSDAQGAAGTPMAAQFFKLTFRLATSDGLDAEQPYCVGLPAWLNDATDGFGRTLFFMQVQAADSSSCSGSSAASSQKSVLATWSAALSDGSSGPQFKSRANAGACPIEGVLLGPLLGRGSYGRVYRGVYHGKPVAVKEIVDATLVTTNDRGEPLEAVLTQDINHLGIMRTVTYGYTLYRKSCWIVFEFCNRTCVQDAVVRGWFRTDRRPTEGGVNLRTVAVTAYEIASAMAFLHKRDIVHGDLKGGNVMLSSSTVNPHGFTAKVGDFGLARQAAAGPHCPTNAYGTVTHMPPEVLLNGQLGKPTDVYSFGVLLWEMLTSSRAWAGMRHTQIICQVGLMKRCLAIPEGLPHAIERLLKRCLAAEVAARCTFDEAVATLSDFLQMSRDEDLSSVQLQLPQEEDA